MVWSHSGFKHWTSTDIKGLIIDVHIVEGTTYYSVINDETGEVLRSQEFDHPMHAMQKAQTEVVSEG